MKYKYVGPVEDGAVISDNTRFDTLTRDSVFIKRELILTLADGAVFKLHSDEDGYFEFNNNEEGREQLKEAEIDQKYKDAVLLIWGK